MNLRLRHHRRHPNRPWVQDRMSHRHHFLIQDRSGSKGN
jgi:hypothetical protein